MLASSLRHFSNLSQALGSSACFYLLLTHYRHDGHMAEIPFILLHHFFWGYACACLCKVNPRRVGVDMAPRFSLDGMFRRRLGGTWRTWNLWILFSSPMSQETLGRQNGVGGLSEPTRRAQHLALCSCDFILSLAN